MILPAVYRDGEAFGKRGDIFSFLSGHCGKWGGRGVKRGSRVFLRRDWRRNRKHYHSHLQVVLFLDWTNNCFKYLCYVIECLICIWVTVTLHQYGVHCAGEKIYLKLDTFHVVIKPPVRTKSLTSIQRKRLTTEPVHKCVHEKHPGQISHWAGLKFNF